jgi:hypothetical protein
MSKIHIAVQKYIMCYLQRGMQLIIIGMFYDLGECGNKKKKIRSNSSRLMA